MPCFYIFFQDYCQTQIQWDHGSMILVIPHHINQDCDNVEDGWTNTEKEQGTDQRLFLEVEKCCFEGYL